MNTTMPRAVPELSDEQIETMRFAIMTEVSSSARQRTRRHRQLVAAAAVVIAVGGLGAGIVSVPAGSGGPDTASMAARDQSAPERAADAKGVGGATSDSAGADSGSAADRAAGRAVITRGSVSMTAAKPVVAAQKISVLVERSGGRIDARSEQAPSADFGGSVHLVVRVPQTRVAGSIEAFGRLGTVRSVNLSDQDVTTQRQDLDARIRALGISVNRLEKLMKASGSTADLLKAETALSQRQAELDSLVARRTQLRDQVSLSALEIDINAKARPNSVSPSGFFGGIVSGWNALVSSIDGLVHGLGVMLPWGLALALLGGIAWLARRVFGTPTKG